MSKKQQLLVNKVAEHATERFGLSDFMITNFKAKDFSITMDSKDYEITVKCKGVASEDIFNNYQKELALLNEAEEVTEE